MTITAEQARALQAGITSDTIKECSIPGYYVTYDGMVISTSNWRGYGVRHLTQFENSHGYLTVKARTPSGRMKKLMVHKEVCSAFHGSKPSRLHEVCHNNGIRTDNRSSNLRWGTRSENAIDRTLHGNSGKKSIPVIAKFPDGSFRRFPSAMNAEKYGFKSRSISKCVSGRQRLHMGAIWSMDNG